MRGLITVDGDDGAAGAFGSSGTPSITTAKPRAGRYQGAIRVDAEFGKSMILRHQ